MREKKSKKELVRVCSGGGPQLALSQAGLVVGMVAGETGLGKSLKIHRQMEAGERKWMTHVPRRRAN